jgi:ergothioneine biosynthesis protein EgtC
MCRLLAYKGPSVILDDLLYEPEHSIINQSYNAKEMEEPLNGDGFGIGWYARDIEPSPAVFKSVQPAWNNQNLQYISPKISSECVFAHVRAASVGGVAEMNCHPFHCGNFIMMHNGGIKNFKEIRRTLLSKLSDAQFHTIQGQTDSEHIFALFLEHLANHSKKHSLSTYKDALKATVDDVLALKNEYGLKETSTLNLFITDGTQIIGCRYITDSDKEPLSLYFARGGRFECQDNKYTLRKTDDNQQAVLFVSERLNKEAQDWEKVPANHFFTVDKDGVIEFTAV